MDKFEPGFYKHFKGGIYLAHGIGRFVPNLRHDLLFAIAKDSEDLEGIDVYKRAGFGNFVLNDFGTTNRQERNGLQYVVYQALYGEGSFWVRPLDDFNGNKEMGNGEGIKRFCYLGKELSEDFLERYSDSATLSQENL